MSTRGRKSAAPAIPVVRGSGKVFADLGLSNPEERLAKAQLAHEISRVIAERGLTQREAATLMGVDQPKVSHILRGRLADFSTEPPHGLSDRPRSRHRDRDQGGAQVAQERAATRRRSVRPAR